MLTRKLSDEDGSSRKNGHAALLSLREPTWYSKGKGKIKGQRGKRRKAKGNVEEQRSNVSADLYSRKRMPPRIFISYRREDAAGDAGRLADHLNRRFGRGQVFLDIDTIDPGTDFVRVLQSSLRETAAVLVVIGQRWTSVSYSSGVRRLDDAKDFVRLEVEESLGRDIPVVPVLVQGATMPRAEESAGIHGVPRDKTGGHARSRGVPRRRESSVRTPREDARAREAHTVVGSETVVAGSGCRCSGHCAHWLLRDARDRSESDGRIDRRHRSRPTRSTPALWERPSQRTRTLPRGSWRPRTLSAGVISSTKR